MDEIFYERNPISIVKLVGKSWTTFEKHETRKKHTSSSLFSPFYKTLQMVLQSWCWINSHWQLNLMQDQWSKKAQTMARFNFTTPI